MVEIEREHTAGPDMTAPCGDGLINLRVGAVILRDGKFLMAGNTFNDYLYSVGGRIRFGETADEMWYIYCDEKERRRRLKESRGYSDEKIDSIMAAQLSEEEFRAGTDVTIDNSGSIEDTRSQVERELFRIRKGGGKRRGSGEFL